MNNILNAVAGGAANAANAASAARAPIRSTIGSIYMGPQKPMNNILNAGDAAGAAKRSWCSCAQPTQPELQFEVL